MFNMRIFLFCTLFLVSSALLSGQNLIGLKYGEIRKYMRENNKDMSYNKVINNEFNYLKYSNQSDSQTVLFFLGADSVCKSIRIIMDQNFKAQKLKELDSAYRKIAVNKWMDSRNGKRYSIELKDEDWASVITISQLK